MKPWILVCLLTACSSANYANEDVIPLEDATSIRRPGSVIAEPQPSPAAIDPSTVEPQEQMAADPGTLALQEPEPQQESLPESTPETLENPPEPTVGPEATLPPPSLVSQLPLPPPPALPSPSPSPSQSPSPPAINAPSPSASARVISPSPSPSLRLSPSPIPVSRPVASPVPSPSTKLSPSPLPSPSPSSELPITITKNDRVVCNPFGGSRDQSANIWGFIHYIPEACVESRFPATAGNVRGAELKVEHFLPGHREAFPCLKRSEAKVGLSSINVPPAAFNKGFKSTSGDLVLDSNRKPIFEFFGLTLYGALQLGPDDRPGGYQIAVLSDDGSNFHVGSHPGPYQTIVQNNNTHPPRLRCSSHLNPLLLSDNMRVDFKLDYFQGPRTMVALMVFWRPVTRATLADPECTAAISSLANTTNMSLSAERLEAFYNKGWRLLGPANFHKLEMEEKACEALKSGGT